MSLDFQFISVVDKLQVTGVTDIEGAIPRTVRVTGTRGFQSAQRVRSMISVLIVLLLYLTQYYLWHQVIP